ncbi:MAG TPA: dienelactone hydrolase family protein [Gemmatimonadaceae bacterium]|mgnify:CR=1 FL=1|nr:dienelactone hydrolase family protein [Gemmatimonadaceae bacterium]
MSSPMPHQGSTHQSSVRIPAGRAMLDADLTIPEGAHGIVIFAHGSGSSRKSTRNRAVAQSLHVAGLATLLLDLLTMEEDAVDRYTAQHRFDIPLLASRLVAAIDWAVEAPETRALPIALFGASTGAAAALIAAAERPALVRAVVSRGGRPDLAGASLPHVRAASLLIIGSRDDEVIALNEQAAAQMTCPREIAIVAGATHLFEEPGTLEEVQVLAAKFIREHIATVAA